MCDAAPVRLVSTAATGPDRRVSEIISSTGDPAFATDEAGLVVAWNAAAEQLLGSPSDAVVGRSCHDLVGGRDPSGNPYCGRECPLRFLVRRDTPVRHFPLDVTTSSGRWLRVLCFVMVVPDDLSGKRSIVHILRSTPQAAPPWPRQVEARRRHDRPHITPRELEVLRQVAEGAATREIAERLSITTSTVRKHVQSLLRKLGVGSRLAAVLAAQSEQLL